jgi:glucosamine-6-phosphate deaminase
MNKIDLTDSLEKIPVKIFPNSNEGSAFIAKQIAALIKQKEKEGKKFCFPTLMIIYGHMSI